MIGLKIENLGFRTAGPLSLSIPAGECVGVRGPSGSGKTLFLRAVADIDSHTGKVFLNGTESADLPAPEWRKQVGMLPAESAWWADTVGEHFSRSGGESPEPETDNWLKWLGFEAEVMDWEIARLSSGERQRLALVRLLANHPKALLLDEPTANLDAENITRMETLVKTYQRENKTPMIWVSHDTWQLDRVASRRLLLKDGGLTDE